MMIHGILRSEYRISTEIYPAVSPMIRKLYAAASCCIAVVMKVSSGTDVISLILAAFFVFGGTLQFALLLKQVYITTH